MIRLHFIDRDAAWAAWDKHGGATCMYVSRTGWWFWVRLA